MSDLYPMIGDKIVVFGIPILAYIVWIIWELLHTPTLREFNLNISKEAKKMKYGDTLDGRVAKQMKIDICSKCCATCRWFERSYEESGCANPEINELRKKLAGKTDYISDDLGAFGGISVHEGNVCELYKRNPDYKEDGIW